MNWTKSFFLNLIVLNYVNLSDVTYEIVTCALTQLLGRTGYSDTTSKSPHLLWLFDIMCPDSTPLQIISTGLAWG
jgi:hypothetical protein